MSGTSKIIDQRQEPAIWEGLKQFASLADWLQAARDPEQVRSALIRNIPEFDSGQLKILSCDIGHIRFKSDFWTGLYELVLEDSGDGKPRNVTLQGTIYPPGTLPPGENLSQGKFGSEEWLAYLPELNVELQMQKPETVLAAFHLLTDPHESRSFLEENIRTGSPKYADLKIQSCTPRVVRYKPGSRCTILYDLEYPPEAERDHAWPELVVAKTYRGDKGQNAYDSMLALWNSTLRSGDVVTVAEPLAYVPEMRVLLQGPIREEQTLKDLISSSFNASTPGGIEEAKRYMLKTAAGLAALHRSGVQMGRLWTWRDELNEVTERINRLAEPLPQLAGAVDPLLERLAALVETIPADPQVPSHGSFRPAQVLLYQGEIGFIDFDSFCQSEPALDLALFLGTVKSIGLDTSNDEMGAGETLDDQTRQARLEQLVAMCDAFLDEYEKYRPVSRQRVALWEALDLMMLVLHGWIKIKPHRLNDYIFLMENHLRTMGLQKL